MIPTNFWLTFVVALIPLIVGFFWYGPVLFHKTWQRESGVTDEMISSSSPLKIFGLAYVYSFLVALFLHMIVIHQFGLSGMFGMLSNQWMVEGSELMNDLDALDEVYQMYSRHRHFGHGVMHGGSFGLIFVGGIIAINGLFERKSWKYMLIHTGYWVVSLALMGGVISQFIQLPL